MKSAENIITHLLKKELTFYASKLGFINDNASVPIDKEFLLNCLSLLNELSVKKDETSKKRLIAICALLWTYKSDEWTGLTDYLLLFLSRAGFGPSSTMVDSQFSRENGQFTAGASLLNQFAVTLEQVKNEIVIKDITYLLSDFQKDIWSAI